MRRHAFDLLLLLAAAPLLCWSQDRGAIIGRVTDPSSAVIAGAAITVTNHADYRVDLDSVALGNLDLLEDTAGGGSLAFGTYEVACEAKGFRKSVRRNNKLDVAQTLTIDIALEIGAVDQTVEVSGAVPLIESSTSDLGTVVDQKQVNDLPLSVSGNMRNPESFVFLAPGVTGDTANTEINGSQDRAKEVLIDGAQSTGPESGGTMFTSRSASARRRSVTCSPP